MVAVIILLVLLILGELFTLMLQCRRGHSAWGLLRLFRYAHRGYHDKPRIPENSMAAFRRAIENGFGAELDVHLMKDGRLAVIHDASLKRTAGADVLVEDLTAEELKTYRLEGTDERIPLLEEVLELFQDRTPLIIELKAERGNHAALAEATCRMLDRYRVHYCIESFDPRCLIWLKKNRPEIVRGQLSEQFLRHGETAGHGKATMWLLGNLFSNIAAKPDFIAYRFSDRDNLCLRWCRKFYHVQEINWTIRTKEEMEAAEAQGNLVIFECFDPKGYRYESHHRNRPGPPPEGAPGHGHPSHHRQGQGEHVLHPAIRHRGPPGAGPVRRHRPAGHRSPEPGRVGGGFCGQKCRRPEADPGEPGAVRTFGPGPGPERRLPGLSAQRREVRPGVPGPPL